MDSPHKAGKNPSGAYFVELFHSEGKEILHRFLPAYGIGQLVQQVWGDFVGVGIDSRVGIRQHVGMGFLEPDRFQNY